MTDTQNQIAGIADRLQRLDDVEKEAFFMLADALLDGRPPDAAVTASNDFLIANGRKPVDPNFLKTRIQELAAARREAS